MRPTRIPFLAAAAALIAAAGCSQEPGVHPGLVTPSEVHAFYVSHPALFEGRRLYSLREIVVSSPAAELAGLEEHVARSRTLREVEAWLAARGARFRTASVTHAAEDVPLRALPRVSSMQPGERAVLAHAEGLSVWELVESRAAPLTEDEATPVIEDFLAGRRQPATLRFARM